MIRLGNAGIEGKVAAMAHRAQGQQHLLKSNCLAGWTDNLRTCEHVNLKVSGPDM